MFFNTSVKNQHLSMNSACTTIYSTKPSQLNFLEEYPIKQMNSYIFLGVMSFLAGEADSSLTAR